MSVKLTLTQLAPPNHPFNALNPTDVTPADADSGEAGWKEAEKHHRYEATSVAGTGRHFARSTGYWQRFNGKGVPPTMIAKALVSVMVISVVIGFGLSTRALAGDGWTQNADCWRAGTPYICRDGWAGANSFFTVQLVDTGLDAAHRSAAESARSSWSSAAGPQSFSWTGGGTSAWLSLDGTLAYGTMTTENDRADGTFIAFNGGTGSIALSKIKSSTANSGHPALVGMWAHEFGHTLGLGHHGNENTAVMWPYNDRNNQAPTSFDIGPTPPCSGATPSYLGVRCIYNFN